MGIGTRGDVLWVDCYRGPGTPRSSSSLGYGRSSADVLVTLLETLGFRVHRVGGNVSAGIVDTASWRLDTFRKVAAHLRNRRPTLVFVFHAFDTPPVEIQRMMLEHDIPHTPLVGYTHGSHWDPTDTWRQEKYQGLDLYDLACLSAFDRLLVVSEYMRETLSQAITRFSSAVAASIISRTTVVGLPIDEAGLTRERQRRQSQGEEVRVLFNHAPTAAKNPEMFLRVMDRILAQRHDVTVVLTRRFGENDPGFDHLGEISTKYEGRVHMGDDFSLPDYYRLLWQCDIQVSTALHESFGVATLEAMFAGNACLLPRHAVYPELCGSIEESLYEYSEEVLSDRLLELIDAPAIRQDLARRLSQRARDVCATARSAFTTIVRDVISQHKVSARLRSTAGAASALHSAGAALPRRRARSDSRRRAQVFTSLYRRNAWNGRETRSGPGSGTEATAALREWLPELLEELGVGSVLDAGCGEATWQPELPGYIGADIVREAVLAARKRHPERTYVLADICRDDLPRTDAVFCRDALQHLSLADGLAALQNFHRSDAKWLIASSHQGEVNRDVPSGGWYPSNLEAAPFWLGKPARTLFDGRWESQDRYPHKIIGAWEL
jgi:glycosyltransferase involved in cell wall biosynthesis/SAM-dependent methyltransferase